MFSELYIYVYIYVYILFLLPQYESRSHTCIHHDIYVYIFRWFTGYVSAELIYVYI
jgi:hypothetical protein